MIPFCPDLTHYKDSLRKQVFDNSASLLAFVAIDYATGEKVCQVLIQLLQSYQTGQLLPFFLEKKMGFSPLHLKI